MNDNLIQNRRQFLRFTGTTALALPFLEHQPEVDAARLGAFGHSMGGKLTTDLAGIDPRVKAAVPSCGGAGDILQSQTDNALVLTFNCNAWGAFTPGKPWQGPRELRNLRWESGEAGMMKP